MKKRFKRALLLALSVATLSASTVLADEGKTKYSTCNVYCSTYITGDNGKTYKAVGRNTLPPNRWVRYKVVPLTNLAYRVTTEEFYTPSGKRVGGQRIRW